LDNSLSPFFDYLLPPPQVCGFFRPSSLEMSPWKTRYLLLRPRFFAISSPLMSPLAAIAKEKISFIPPPSLPTALYAPPLPVSSSLRKFLLTFISLVEILHFPPAGGFDSVDFIFFSESAFRSLGSLSSEATPSSSLDKVQLISLFLPLDPRLFPLICFWFDRFSSLKFPSYLSLSLLPSLRGGSTAEAFQ